MVLILQQWAKNIPLPHSVEAIEAFAAVHFAKDLNIHKLEFEGGLNVGHLSLERQQTFVLLYMDILLKRQKSY